MISINLMNINLCFTNYGLFETSYYLKLNDEEKNTTKTFLNIGWGRGELGGFVFVVCLVFAPQLFIMLFT